MNIKLFLRLIVTLTIIGLVSCFVTAFTAEDNESLISLLASLPGVIILAPFLLWHDILNFNPPESNVYYLAAGFFDIILYSFTVERLVAVWKKWTGSKRR